MKDYSVVLIVNYSENNGGKEFQKLNEAYKRLMYESKFPNQKQQNQDPGAHRYQDPRDPRYQNPWAQRYQDPRDPRYQDRSRYRNPDPRNYSHGGQNPFNNSYNDHRNPRSDGHRYDNPWTNQWDKSYGGSNESETGEQRRRRILQQALFRRALYQALVGCLLIQFFFGVLFKNSPAGAHNPNNPKNPDYPTNYSMGCQCLKCKEDRSLAEQAGRRLV